MSKVPIHGLIWLEFSRVWERILSEESIGDFSPGVTLNGHCKGKVLLYFQMRNKNCSEYIRVKSFIAIICLTFEACFLIVKNNRVLLLFNELTWNFIVCILTSYNKTYISCILTRYNKTDKTYLSSISLGIIRQTYHVLKLHFKL